MPLIVQPTTKKIILPVIFIILTVGLLSWALYITKDSTPAQAASRSDWIAGNIISDSNFTDKDSMSVAEIQSFLDSKIGNCDIWGTGRATEFGSNLTRAQYAASRGWAAPPYTCLNKYYEVPKTSPGGTLPANNYSNPTSIPTGAQSAAWIIKDAANRYNISPKVLLVKIATESAGPLTSDSWPLFSQYRYAMGSNCPDSGPNGSANCDSNYAGFSIQMYSAAQLMRWYLDSMEQPWWSYKKPGNNQILWNVIERGCGGANVFIENKATAALYTYTPYQPNNAALNNMYGTGDNCSAYGNRNVWRVYWDWFGNTRNDHFEPFIGSRWMTIYKNSQFVDPITGRKDLTVEAGRQEYFTTKAYVNGKWYYRTDRHTASGSYLSIPADDIREIEFENASQSRWMKVTKNSQFVDPITGRKDLTVEAGRQEYIVSKVLVNGRWYHRTDRHTASGSYLSIPADDMANIEFENASQSRWMKVTKNSQFVDPITGRKTDQVTSGADIFVTSKVYIDKQWYHRGVEAENSGSYLSIPADDMANIEFENASQSRWMKVTKNSQFVDPITGRKDLTVEAGRQEYIVSKVLVNGRWYHRTDRHTASGSYLSIPADDMANIEFEQFVAPRRLTIYKNSQFVDPITGRKDLTVEAGRQEYFTTKAYVNGKWYYRTDRHTASGSYLSIPADDIRT